MALKSTICKATLDDVDMDRNHYAEYRLTLARHPSETDERMMLRLLAFALNADERLAFGKGISDSDEPDLWLKDLSGGIELWVELGQPDERIVAKACKRSARVVVYPYSQRPALWWDPLRDSLSRFPKLSVVQVDAGSARALGALASTDMDIQVSVQDGQVTVRDDDGAEVPVALTVLS